MGMADMKHRTKETQGDPRRPKETKETKETKGTKERGVIEQQ
jgi:hypothetical protein